MSPSDSHALLFDFEADHLALDFVNAGRGATRVRAERLPSPASVIAWLVEAGVLGDVEAARLRTSVPDARLLLTEAHRLRDAIEEMVEAWTGGVLLPSFALLGINRVAASHSGSWRLVLQDASTRVEASARGRAPVGVLAPVAEAAARLVAEVDPARVRRCEAPGCGLWFLDRSKNGRRRWCSMARCGNRAKVAAHYRRRKGAGG